jgi:hypothetical protein
MRISRFSKAGRWLGAVAVAVTGIGLTARGSQAAQTMFTYIALSNPSCNQDSNGFYFAALGLGSASNGEQTCIGWESAETVNSSGYGSTAQSTCSYGGAAIPPTVFVTTAVESINTSNGGFASFVCGGQKLSFTQTSTCQGSPPVTSLCPAGSTISAGAFGENY